MVIPVKFIIMSYSIPQTIEEEKMERSPLASRKIMFSTQQVTLSSPSRYVASQSP